MKSIFFSNENIFFIIGFLLYFLVSFFIIIFSYCTIIFIIKN